MKRLSKAHSRTGAPYLPTRRTNADAMFAQLRAALGSARPQSKRLQFVDLGSGDGRLVFRASREGYHAIGCEINPLLHLFAQGARLCRPQYWSSTRFYRRDLWKVDLRQANVVAVVSRMGMGVLRCLVGLTCSTSSMALLPSCQNSASNYKRNSNRGPLLFPMFLLSQAGVPSIPVRRERTSTGFRTVGYQRADDGCSCIQVALC